jgi:hypothetical protein
MACVLLFSLPHAPAPWAILPQLGGKGANLCEMARLGVNIPAGFTITTEVCQEFYRVGEERDGSNTWGLHLRSPHGAAPMAPFEPMRT